MPTLRETLKKLRGPTARRLEKVQAAVDRLAHDNVALQEAVEGAATENRMLRARLRRLQDGVSSGVELRFGEFEYERNKKLRGDLRWEVLDDMESDAHVKGALRVSTLPLRNATWEIIPASEEPRDVQAKNLCHTNLLREVTEDFGRRFYIATSWKAQRIEEILDFLKSGFSAFAASWKLVETWWVYARLQWLEPSTIEDWAVDDEDNFLGFTRTYYKQQSQRSTQRKVTIRGEQYVFDEGMSAERIKLYPWELKGARFEGRPFLRSMYGPWFRKQFSLQQAMIAAQKVGAPSPHGFYPADWQDQNVIRRFREYIESLRGTAPAEAYGMFPMGKDGTEPKIDFAGSDVEVDRMRSIIEGENAEIAHAGGSKTSLLGETESGSRALGGTLGLLEMFLVQAIAETICEYETHGVGNLPGPIEELADANFTDLADTPKLACSRINPFEGFEHFDDLMDAIKSGVIPKHPLVRKMVTELFDITLPDEVFEQEAVPVGVPGDGSTPPESGDGDDGEDGDGQRDPVPPGGGDRGEADDPDEVLASASNQALIEALRLASRAQKSADVRKRIADLLEPVDGPKPQNLARKPNKLEAATLDLAAVSGAFRTGEADTLQVLRRVREAMRDELMKRLTGGKISKGNLGGQRRSKFRGEAKWTKELLDLFEEIGEIGVAHTEEEAQRQKESGL